MTHRVQIVATIGPASARKSVIKEMIARHMDVARLNFSWSTHEEHAQHIKDIREAARELGKNVLILQDLSGPRIQHAAEHSFDAGSYEAITEKDRADLRFGLAHGVDYVAMSFVGSADDILRLKEEINTLGYSTPVIAKIERKAALENIDEIINVSDAIMIARGDLGHEVPLETIPFTEKSILEKCKKEGKPVITATQMLLSMVNNEQPTRAEVTDVDFAIMSGSDAVMLSEETASGKHPVEAVGMMDKIITEAEHHMGDTKIINPL